MPDHTRYSRGLSRRAIEAILDGKDSRLLVVVGPCSVHDTKAALEYATRLKPIADALADALLIVMRVYFEKPRTVVGWKGLINDPDLDESYHINKGLRLARRLLRDINALGWLGAGWELRFGMLAWRAHNLEGPMKRSSSLPTLTAFLALQACAVTGGSPTSKDAGCQTGTERCASARRFASRSSRCARYAA